MKRQGTYGFTFDSKAEEWWGWRRSKALMYQWQWTRKMKREMREYGWRHFKKPQWYLDSKAADQEIDFIRRKSLDELAAIDQELGLYDVDTARHSPAQQQNAPEIGVTTTRPRNRVLWPLAAGGAVCVTVALVLAKQAGWL